MKHTITLIAFLLSVSGAFADIMPPNSHKVDLCVKIQDWSNALTNISVEGNIKGPMVNGENTKKISPDTCLSKGYKFNTLEILITDPEGKKHSLGTVETRKGYVDDSNPLAEEEIIYAIEKNKTSYDLVVVSKKTKNDMSIMITKRNIIVFTSLLFIIAATIISIRKRRK